ncbi:hypothetical protein PGT21_018431 [Puccinia graminis f. sp. tritici]|uniref:Uncharacterized protein n=1 Tax=Puccinia graminis f. sp. tritici TaxID=56615 RepID=A0A5B0NXF4_PUCGR|nr:hypothetical protein PGT21_018431 [Puccinia graminis f. sp. tritici]KAA1093412.1 hypothetical protein PGTUg99_010256 [Puccinia graminis f. sp. tritici]
MRTYGEIRIQVRIRIESRQSISVQVGNPDAGATVPATPGPQQMQGEPSWDPDWELEAAGSQQGFDKGSDTAALNLKQVPSPGRRAVVKLGSTRPAQHAR